MTRPAQTSPRTLTRPDDFVAAGLIASEQAEAFARLSARYSAAMTGHLASLVDANDPADPIARQFVPDPRELETTPQERADPIGDDAHSPCEGLVHRYPDRVLLKLVSACPVYCRFCFRRETVGAAKGGMLAPEKLAAALDYIRARPQIWEVILTGGDPLALSPRRLAETVRAIAAIDHVKVLRFHTRVPVAAPDLVTDDLVAAIRADGVSTWVAIHANHPREIGAEARAALDRFVATGVPLVSQTVLLRGVNDDPEILAALMRAFVEARVKPYYLHHPDLAPGTGHFRLSIAEGRRIVAELMRRVSGLARPAYVLDIPGGYGKIPLGSEAAAPDGAGGWRLEDSTGRIHPYRDA
ncbi:MAG: lysine-2,3-aminomutase-like protein [Methylobacteriaceae bacterium]|nr:lysine-2,3-aminomutase-like protein [Methylobacteriaceae bacterium]